MSVCPLGSVRKNGCTHVTKGRRKSLKGTGVGSLHRRGRAVIRTSMDLFDVPVETGTGTMFSTLYVVSVT